MASLPTGTLTFLFTDIEGSTALWERHPDAMRAALARHDAILQEHIAAQQGVVFKTIGDAFCAAFPTAPDALAAALKAQQTLQSEPWDATGPLRVRMALNTGAAEARGGDYYGPPLNRVARLLSVGHGEQVLLFPSTVELVRGLAPQAVGFKDLGAHKLKDLQRAEIFQLTHPDLRADFPELRSLNNRCNNLPAQLTTFIGREREILELNRLFHTSRLLTLTGSGGCGKTRLALHAAAELLEGDDAGVWLVEFASLSQPEWVPQTVATALGLHEEPGKPLAQTLIEFIQARPLLLILDNCEHLLVACATLAETLLRACPNIHLLATSREALGIPGETTFRIPSLSLPDPKMPPTLENALRSESIRLFVERARAVQPSFALAEADVPALVQLCRRLDGIPFAIELAAARVSALSISQIATRLDDRFRLLTGGSRTALPRQQTLRAMIDWSYGLLSPQEQALLRRLAVFAGGWDLEAAERVCADPGGALPIEDWEILDLMQALIQKSLVDHEVGAGGAHRYCLQESVHEYAETILTDTNTSLERYPRQHLNYYLHLAEQAHTQLQGPEQAAWLDRLEEENDNLRSALNYALGRKRRAQSTSQAPQALPAEDVAPQALRLVAALIPFWQIRGYFREGSDYLRAILALPEAPDTAPIRIRALNGAGMLARFQGDYSHARQFHRQSLALAEASGNRQAQAETLLSLATLDYYYVDDTAAAHVHLRAALDVTRSLGDGALNATAQHRMGMVATETGDWSTAHAAFQESLRQWEALGDRTGIAEVRMWQGWLATRQGDYPTAHASLNAGLLALRILKDRLRLNMVFFAYADLAGAEGRSEHAACLWGIVHTLVEELGAAIPPRFRAAYDRNMNALRQTLGDTAFDAAFALGSALSLEAAIEAVLQEEAISPG